jgi:hypothetical protein
MATAAFVILDKRDWLKEHIDGSSPLLGESFLYITDIQ